MTARRVRPSSRRTTAQEGDTQPIATTSETSTIAAPLNKPQLLSLLDSFRLRCVEDVCVAAAHCARCDDFDAAASLYADLEDALRDQRECEGQPMARERTPRFHALLTEMPAEARSAWLQLVQQNQRDLAALRQPPPPIASSDARAPRGGGGEETTAEEQHDAAAVLPLSPSAPASADPCESALPGEDAFSCPVEESGAVDGARSTDADGSAVGSEKRQRSAEVEGDADADIAAEGRPERAAVESTVSRWQRPRKRLVRFRLLRDTGEQSRGRGLQAQETQYAQEMSPD